MALTTTTNGSASQTTTQNPQTASGSSGFGNTGPASGVQPGTASNLLSQSSGGIALHATPLTTVSLGGTTASQTQLPVPVKHHINPALFSVSILFFIVAVALFWFTSRSEKITT